MNRRFQTVLTMLKPRVKAFGFNYKEIKSVAAKIADNLTSEEDASDEDVNAEIEKAIEAVLPILELGRSYANRVINDSKKNDDEETDSDDEDEESKQSHNKSTKTKHPKTDDMPAWAKALIESNNSLKSELAGLKGERITDTRKSRLEKLLKDTGAFGARTLKSFARMKFETDEEFDEFVADVEDDLKALNQERANAGLATMGAPATGTNGKKGKEQDEVLSDEDIKALAQI